MSSTVRRSDCSGSGRQTRIPPARFSYSANGTDFEDVGEPLALKQGRWIGTKIGLFALGTAPVSEYGYADVDWFRVD